MALLYFINRKQAICVVSFRGSIDVADVSLLDRCCKEILSDPTSFVLLHMKELSVIDFDSVRPFAIFQQTLRSRANLLLCAIPKEIEKTLKTAGVLRESEICEDLVSGLQKILQKIKFSNEQP